MAESKTSASDYISGSLRHRITVFLDDLQSFNEERLRQNYVDSTFMSSTYFTDDEIERLQALSIRGKTLKEKLHDLVGKRTEKDGMICSSHDLKPIYETYFGFDKADMRKTTIEEARTSWGEWRTSFTGSEPSLKLGAREALEKRVQKARRKNRNKEVERLSLMLDNTDI